MKTQYQTLCTITPAIVNQVARISEVIGGLSAQADTAKALRLRCINCIRAIQRSLAIEEEADQA